MPKRLIGKLILPAVIMIFYAALAYSHRLWPSLGLSTSQQGVASDWIYENGAILFGAVTAVNAIYCIHVFKLRRGAIVLTATLIALYLWLLVGFDVAFTPPNAEIPENYREEGLTIAIGLLFVFCFIPYVLLWTAAGLALRWLPRFWARAAVQKS
ncbi:MAG: hypothetical protein JSR45_01010 [Proteobacteria bacterium]|nr:hypothetical protein [Pseudomonadota bacterium]